MAKATVVKSFHCRLKNKRHLEGAEYEGSDERIAELESRGFVSTGKPKEKVQKPATPPKEKVEGNKVKGKAEK